MKIYKVGITDYVKPPYTIEKSAFPKKVEFIQLDLDKNKRENDIEVIRKSVELAS